MTYITVYNFVYLACGIYFIFLLRLLLAFDRQFYILNYFVIMCQTILMKFLCWYSKKKFSALWRHVQKFYDVKLKMDTCLRLAKIIFVSFGTIGNFGLRSLQVDLDASISVDLPWISEIFITNFNEIDNNKYYYNGMLNVPNRAQAFCPKSDQTVSIWRVIIERTANQAYCQ